MTNPAIQMPARIKLDTLNKACQDTYETTVTPERLERVAECFEILQHLELWSVILRSPREAELYRLAQLEFLTAVLDVCQGQYRNALKCLRLFLELYLQGTLLSVDRIRLDEWLRGDSQTSWSAITNSDTGLYSLRFVKAFFPELSEKMPTYCGIAKNIYKELSEAIHGNLVSSITIPNNFTFNQELFDLFMEKSTTIDQLISFTLVMRYGKELTSENKEKLGYTLIEKIGHIQEVRGLFGGVVDGK
jgi:hypothetical protein